MTLKWGVLGPGGIVETIFPAVFYPGSPNVFFAVASRSLSRAEAFVKKYVKNVAGVRCYGSYDALINDPEVQAVYIATPTVGRLELVLKCAKAGKHVVAEKPLAETAKEVEQMIDACCSHNVVFIDATHWVHLPRSRQILSALRSPSFGTVIDVSASFQVAVPYSPDQIRYQIDTEPLGALGDLGWYSIRMILWAFGNLEPVKVLAVSSPITKTNPAIAGMSGVIVFPPLEKEDGTLVGRQARFSCSFQSPFVQSATICSTGQSIEISDFVHPWSWVTTRGAGPNPAFPTQWRQSKTGGHATSTLHTAEVDVIGVDVLFRRVAGLVEAGKRTDEEIESFLRSDVLTHRIFEAAMESAKRGGTAVDVGRDGKGVKL